MRAMPPRVPCLLLLNNNIRIIVIFISIFRLSKSANAVLFERKTHSELFNDEMVDLKEVAGAVKVELPARPVFLEKHGTEGINYSLDNRSRPFIYCDYYDVNACDPAVRNCPTTKMCYAAASEHRLGCMAALVNNSSSRQITLKGCWMHDGNLGNCDNEACVAEERPTGHVNAVLFCCCSTHNCNRRIRFPAHSQPTVAPSTVAPAEDDDPGLFASDSWVAGVIIFGIFVACLLVLLCYWTYREFRSNKQMKSKTVNDFSLPRMGDATNPLMESTKDDCCRNVTSLELVARGRFGQVFRGQLDGNDVAVKEFPAEDVNSWIVEQEIYALPALRKHDNILHYIGAEVHGNRYWLITEYHQNGSLHDYLKPHVLTLHQALKIIATLLRGLSFLHEEKTVDGELKPCVVHRDFKSRNVLLKDDLTAVIADFGLALKCENGQMPAEDHHGQVGTRRYMSPEVLEGATEFTAFAFRQIDVYAAALVIWEVLSRTLLFEGDTVDDYRQPYEEEAGLQPSLHDLRRIVAVQKTRPRIRHAINEHNIGSVLWKTVEDMWDMEPDGRITAGCAYERANTLFMSYAIENSTENTQIHNSRSLNGPPPPYSQVHTSDDLPLRPALMIKDGSLGSNGFNATMDECAQACSAPPNVRFVGDEYARPLRTTSTGTTAIPMDSSSTIPQSDPHHLPHPRPHPHQPSAQTSNCRMECGGGGGEVGCAPATATATAIATPAAKPLESSKLGTGSSSIHSSTWCANTAPVSSSPQQHQQQQQQQPLSSTEMMGVIRLTPNSIQATSESIAAAAVTTATATPAAVSYIPNGVCNAQKPQQPYPIKGTAPLTRFPNSELPLSR